MNSSNSGESGKRKKTPTDSSRANFRHRVEAERYNTNEAAILTDIPCCSAVKIYGK